MPNRDAYELKAKCPIGPENEIGPRVLEDGVSSVNGHLIIAPGTTLNGQIRGGEHVEIRGAADGSIVTKHLVICEGGDFQGSVRVDTAEVHGRLRGDVAVKNLLSISASGDVEGDIQYGQLALASGANLVADLRNVPPELSGDFELEVSRGGNVKITPQDLKATDAEDGAESLVFSATNLLHGHIAHANTPTEPLEQFTQADINSANIIFVHSGAKTNIAGFDVEVKDSAGSTAGAVRPVLVRVQTTGSSFGATP